MKLSRALQFSGQPQIPGDKSISHRALIFGALAEGQTRVSGLLRSADVLSTWSCLRGLGVQIENQDSNRVQVRGMGLRGFLEPSEPLDCGNSGTTIRLLMGVLAGQKFSASLIGDASLQKRPMKRVAEPLRSMGATLELREGAFAPVLCKGLSSGNLRPIQYSLPIASAQLKSALLLAGLYAEGITTLGGEIHSRDHTERMLKSMGVHIQVQADLIQIQGQPHALQAVDVRVPGDFSTAAFWIAAASIIPGARIEMHGISLNPTRLGFFHVLQRMGAKITIDLREEKPEPWGSLFVETAPLQAVSVDPSEVPELIDELPILAVLATQAEGLTRVTGAAELRVKESDRIEMTGQALRAMGAEIKLLEDGFEVRGPQKLLGARIQTEGDHRIAMAFSIAALIADGTTEIENSECVAVSYPQFYSTLKELCHG